VQQRARGLRLGVQQRRLGRGRAAVDALVLERREPAEPAARAGALVEQLKEPQPTPADGVMDEWRRRERHVRSFGVVELQQLQLDADGRAPRERGQPAAVLTPRLLQLRRSQYVVAALVLGRLEAEREALVWEERRGQPQDRQGKTSVTEP
jgi:hypothetical protein